MRELPFDTYLLDLEVWYCALCKVVVYEADTINQALKQTNQIVKTTSEGRDMLLMSHALAVPIARKIKKEERKIKDFQQRYRFDKHYLDKQRKKQQQPEEGGNNNSDGNNKPQ